MAKTVNPKATPYIRPESDLKVTYLIFPGTAEKERSAPDLVKWKEKCSALLGEVGGVGAGFLLHTWEEPFKKPEPPVVLPADGTTAPPPAPSTATPPTTQPGTATPLPPTPVPAISPPPAVAPIPAPATPPPTQSNEVKSTPKAAAKKSSSKSKKGK